MQTRCTGSFVYFFFTCNQLEVFYSRLIYTCRVTMYLSHYRRGIKRLIMLNSLATLNKNEKIIFSSQFLIGIYLFDFWGFFDVDFVTLHLIEWWWLIMRWLINK
jgi:hypothetical protein